MANLLQHKDENATVKIIDPAQLIEEQKKDEGMKYHYLLEDLDEQGRPYPPGLITAVIKQEIYKILNTREGTFDTNFIIKTILKLPMKQSNLKMTFLIFKSV